MSLLDQILSFVNVGAGATVALPHRININGTPVVPDFAFRDNGNFDVVSVSATIATVKNNAVSPQTLNLYLWRRHTHERAYGAAQINNLIPQPFVPAAGGGGGGGGGGSSTCLTYQPFGAQTGPTVFNDWDALYAQLQALRAANNGSGCYEIIFDNGDQSTCTIPQGFNYDMTNVTWSGKMRYLNGPGTDNQSLVQLSNPVTTLPGLRHFTNNLRVEWLGFTPSVTDIISPFDPIIIEEGAEIVGTSEANAMFVLNTDGAEAEPSNEIRIRSGGKLHTQGANPIVNLASSSIRLLVSVEGRGSLLGEGTFGGDAGAQIEVRAAEADGIQCIVADSQPGFPGTVNFGGSVGRYRLNPLDAPSQTDFALLVDTVNRFISNDVVVVGTLPPAAFSEAGGAGRGQIVVVKHAFDNAPAFGTGVAPSGADTIDGANALFPFIAPQQCAVFVSDGVSNWMVISNYP